MFNEIGKMIHAKWVKKFLKENQIIKNGEIFELKNIVAELQNSLGMFNNRLDQAEEMMRHLKLHNQRKKGKRMKREWRKLKELIGYCKMHQNMPY